MEYIEFQSSSNTTQSELSDFSNLSCNSSRYSSSESYFSLESESSVGISSKSYFSFETQDRAIHFENDQFQTYSEKCVIKRLFDILQKIKCGSLTPSSFFEQISCGISVQTKGDAYAHQKGLEFCCIAEAAYHLVQSGQIAYQRDIFYRYKNILQNVSNVSKICQQMAEFLGIHSSQLNILPSPKGMIFGSIDIELSNGTVSSCLWKNGQYIPPVSLVQQVICRHEIKAIILVEKQTAFQALLECGFDQYFPWAMLITGKGYPDKNTCKFLMQINQDIPVHTIVDYDPDGACIYKTYAEYYSSKRPYCPANINWAGLHCNLARIGRWGLDVSKMTEYTQRDRKLSFSLIKHWKNIPAYRRIMAKMVYCGKKVELEAVTQIRPMLLNYIRGLIGND